MLKELTDLAEQIKIVQSSIVDGTVTEFNAAKLAACFDDFVAVLARHQRPDAELAALMLLSEGQRAIGDCDSRWDDAVKVAERLLGIVPLEDATE
jgi:hypothetical protein